MNDAIIGLLSPTTLAAIIGDLERFDRGPYDVRLLEKLTTVLIANVGTCEAERMIHDAIYV